MYDSLAKRLLGFLLFAGIIHACCKERRIKSKVTWLTFRTGMYFVWNKRMGISVLSRGSDIAMILNVSQCHCYLNFEKQLSSNI